MLTYRNFAVGSRERLYLLAPHRLIARDDQNATICSGVNLLDLPGPGTVPATPGWKPSILKQTNNAQTITFFLPTLTDDSTGGGDAFEVRFAVRGYDSQGHWKEETFRKVCPSKLGTSTDEAFAAYTTETLWDWVLEIELLEYVTTGSTINGFYVGHAIGDEVLGFHYEHDGTSYDIGTGRQIDRIVAHDGEAQTLTTFDASNWSYNPVSGHLHVQTEAAWAVTQGLYVISRPSAR